MVSQNIYEYKKIKPVGILVSAAYPSLVPNEHLMLDVILKLRDKIDEVVIQLNQTNKDFELYKKAFKQYVSEHT